MSATKRILLLSLSVFMIFMACDKVEEPQAPIARMEMRDNLGSWNLSGLPNAKQVIRFRKGLNGINLIQLEFHFKHSSRGRGQFKLEIVDTEIKAESPIVPIELRIPDEVSVFLRYPDTSPDVAWVTNKSENVLFRITKLTEFEDQQYASGNWVLRVFDSSANPSDLEIRGDFINFKVQVD